MTPKQLLNLPATRITLVGRSAELDSLAGQALNVPGRLLTLTGPGGVGKTSLALAVARRISPEFAAGVCLADLSAVTGEETLRLAVANAVGVRESAERPLKEALLSFLRDVEMLLVVDNCEHVIDTCAALIDELLAGCARLRILATSREALRISGEVTYTVDPLPIPSAELSESPAALVENASVELFLERARAVRPGLKLTARNSGAITEICRRLEGIPLGLELAASQAAGLSLDAIAGRLGESFDLLMGRSRLRPRRQQTLRATLEWSHDLLSPPEQAVFRRLAAFAGGWTAEAARFVCEAEGIEGESVVDQLAGLVEKSLAVFEERDGTARYRFLEPVRQYAQGRLAASGESGAVRTRHCAFFVSLAEEAEPEIHRAQQGVWMRRLDRDFDNLRTAVRTANTRSDAESVLRLTGALWWYLWVRGHLREAVEWLEPALDREAQMPARSAGPARTAGLRAAAMLLGSLGRSGEATARAAEMITLARRAGDLTEAARAATLLAMEAFRAGDVERAMPFFEEALTAAREAKHPMLNGNALVNLGQLVHRQGDVPRAEALYREGLAQFESEGDVWGIAYAANNIAVLLREKGEFGRAALLSSRAVRLLNGLGDRFYLIFAVEDLARAVAGAGRPEPAVRLFGAAAALRLASGALLPPGGQANHDRDVGSLRAALGEGSFVSAWSDGERRALEPLVAEALAQRPQGTAATVGEVSRPGEALTSRELQVARRLAGGGSNQQIAAELGIAVGTVRIHVEHILAKLNMHSRHQVADWARANGVLTD